MAHMLDPYIQKMTSEAALKDLKRWRIIQFASILPLILCMVWMFYFREASEFGIVGFFLTLVIGVMFPEVKADLAATNFLIRQELATHREEIQKLLTEQLQNPLRPCSTRPSHTRKVEHTPQSASQLSHDFCLL